MTSPFEFLAPRHDYALSGGWSRRVLVAGVEYIVGVERGKPVRIAFKPRGQNRGWTWSGFVRDAKGRTVWSGDVGKTIGARGLLRCAHLLPSSAESRWPSK